MKIDQQPETLNLKDLLVDEKSDELSEYLSLSFDNIGDDTKVSVTTIEETPTTYSSTFTGVTFTDFQYLVDGSNEIIPE